MMRRNAAILPVALACISVGLASCGEVIESSALQKIHDPVTGTIYELNTNRRIITEQGTNQGDGSGKIGHLQNAINANGITTDWSGRTLVQIVECNSGANRTGSISLGCSIDSDYVLIGGGAQDVYTGYGAMLWESRPIDFDDNTSGLTWAASSKDQFQFDSHKLYVWAVGLKLKKTDGTWMSHYELKQFIHYRVTQTAPDSHPSGTCIVPFGDVVIGGGARSNYGTGYGQLLTASYPSNSQTWYGESKDHISPDPASLNVYCIGINPSIPGFGNLVIDRLKYSSYASSGAGIVNGNVGNSPASVPACYGGVSNYNGSGRMLFRMSPGDYNIRTFTAASKDHRYLDSGWTDAWITQVRLQ